MRIESLKIEQRGPQTGLSAFNNDNYLGTYQSFHELMLDLVYRFDVDNLTEIKKAFQFYRPDVIIEPYKYRGICSEIFWPTDTFPFRYIYYCNTLSELFTKFEIHEKRARDHQDFFYYGPQGTGIHIFNSQSMKYELWVGGVELHTVSDVMNKVQKEGLPIPSSLQLEYDETGHFDVFISHKSEDYGFAKKAHDVLTHNGYKVFLSEITLPAISSADYTNEINKALNNSTHLVVIADSSDKITSGWVKYEWSSFLNEVLSGRKTGNLVTVTTNNMSIDNLPYSLRQFEVVKLNDIEDLKKWLPI